MSISFQKPKYHVAKLDLPSDIPYPLMSVLWPLLDSIAQWTRCFSILYIFPRPFMFCCINPTKQTNKHLHLITSLKSTFYKQTSHIFANILRDPSLRLGGLDPRALNTGLYVSLSFSFPIVQITGLQHSGDQGGRSEEHTSELQSQ